MAEHHATRGAASSLTAAVLLGAFVAGTLDLVWAVVSYGLDLPVILRSIAGGWLGAGARGLGATLLGAVSHYAILIVAALLYALAARRLSILARRPILSGLLYGLAIYLVMNFVVVPLSASPLPTPGLADNLHHVLAHMILVGLPIAWFAARWARHGR